MTSFENKCSILADLWTEYRDNPDFVNFQEYNDLGLPIAYAIANNMVIKAPASELFVNETFDLLLSALEIPDDTGFETLEEILELSA
jgi:hypothetical protein